MFIGDTHNQVFSHQRYIMVKIFIQASSMGQQVDNELEMYKYIKRSSAHRGHNTPWIISILSIILHTLVYNPLYHQFYTIHLLFLIIDIEAENIIFGIKDNSVFTHVIEYEFQAPVPRKEVNTDGTLRTIYMSQNSKYPNKSAPQYFVILVLPYTIYRAPEVILGIPWTFSVDIWNVGCMIWDLYEGGSLFTGQDPKFQRYRNRAHLSEMVNLLGPPPPSLITQGELSNKFFSSEGLLTGPMPLEQREPTLARTAEREAFLRLMRKMLQWEPDKCSSAKELAEDEWIHSHIWCCTMER
ncbi:hypothetical protein N7488_011194 [Penicillium malachiteum]|nr:hypothetical protein N7488_011194 [Penicillium malachiteum]